MLLNYVADLLPATGETGIAETGRAGTRFSSGAKGFRGNQAYTNCVGFLCCKAR